MSQPKITRPSLSTALAAWHEALDKAGRPAETLWIFPENLCIEFDPPAPAGLRVAFQTKFTPPDDDALEIAYDIFAGTAAPIVFYRLGTSGEKSVCILLCDPWLEKRGGPDGFESVTGWNIAFRTGPSGNIEEVTDLKRWVRRVKRGRDLQDFDFGMALATIDEIKLHGRPLLPYERFSQSTLNQLRRRLGNPD